jgi:site-specific DNA-methyltransferase (cytosine-N4-specific)
LDQSREYIDPSGTVFIVGDARSIPLRDNSVRCVVTSPPYFQTRDYGHGAEQLGLEVGIKDYISNLVNCFEEVKRVLCSDGTAWVVIGNTYNTNGIIHSSAHQRGLGHIRPTNSRTGSEAVTTGFFRYASRTGSNLKNKDLCGCPWRFAIAMIDAGWFLRSEVIWDKTMPRPESANDRPSRNHEQIFLFARSKRYFFNKHKDVRSTVWPIQIAKIKKATGLAVFPGELARRCILASSEEGDIVLDPFAGSGITLLEAEKLKRRAVGIDLTDKWWMQRQAERTQS